MTHMRLSIRRAALLVGVITVASSCDTRLPTQGGLVDDVERPQVKFLLSTGASTTLDVGSAVSVSITATDNKGVSSILTVARNGALVLGVDSVTVKPAAATFTRVVPLTLVGVLNGDKVTIRTTVTDIAYTPRWTRSFSRSPIPRRPWPRLCPPRRDGA